MWLYSSHSQRNQLTQNTLKNKQTEEMMSLFGIEKLDSPLLDRNSALPEEKNFFDFKESCKDYKSWRTD